MAKIVVEPLIAPWRAFGLPDSAQFDNDTIFPGPPSHPDVVGRVSRLCLSLGVTPVVVVPREFGSPSMIEDENGTWQAKVDFLHAPLGSNTPQVGRQEPLIRRTSLANRQ